MHFHSVEKRYLSMEICLPGEDAPGYCNESDMAFKRAGHAGASEADDGTRTHDLLHGKQTL